DPGGGNGDLRRFGDQLPRHSLQFGVVGQWNDPDRRGGNDTRAPTGEQSAELLGPPGGGDADRETGQRVTGIDWGHTEPPFMSRVGPIGASDTETTPLSTRTAYTGRAAVPSSRQCPSISEKACLSNGDTT